MRNVEDKWNARWEADDVYDGDIIDAEIEGDAGTGGRRRRARRPLLIGAVLLSAGMVFVVLAYQSVERIARVASARDVVALTDIVDWPTFVPAVQGEVGKFLEGVSPSPGGHASQYLSALATGVAESLTSSAGLTRRLAMHSRLSGVTWNGGSGAEILVDGRIALVLVPSSALSWHKSFWRISGIRLATRG